MKPIKLLIVSLSALSLIFTSSNALAQHINVKSSCRIYTSACLVEKGKCTIRTYIEGDYIIAEIYKSWEKNSKPTYKLRFTNRPDCTSWQWESDNGCNVELGYGDEWSYVAAGDNEENGKKTFGYTVGSAYSLQYDGPFPRP
jgi:hypothetical protein